MDEREHELLVEVAAESLLRAQNIWNSVEGELLQKALRESYAERVPSNIPGHPEVGLEPKVDDFVAMVVDMRDSTVHLAEASAGKVSGLQRVFYETSTLLPTVARAIQFGSGKVTEYLGDGLLALFSVEPGAPYHKELLTTAKKVLMARHITNIILDKMYGNPAIDVGVGLAQSQAVVTLVGLEDYPQPRVFGKCVFRASKLSKGRNTICIDETLDRSWPTGEGGTLKMVKIDSEDLGFSGYELQWKGGQ